MKPGARYRQREQMTRAGNHTAAVAKATTAPLHALTDAMLESIAASHARRGSADFGKLVAQLREIVAGRRDREAA